MRVTKKQPRPALPQAAKADPSKKPAPAKPAAPRRPAAASARADGFEAPAPRDHRASVLGDPQPVVVAQTPILTEPAPADAARLGLDKATLLVTQATSVFVSASVGEGPAHFTATQQVDPVTHELVIVVDAWRRAGEPPTGQPQNLGVLVSLPDALHQWTVSVRDPAGRVLASTVATPPPLPEVTALGEAAPEGSTHLDPGALKAEMSLYRLGTLELSGSNLHGPVRYHAETQVDEANHKVVVVLDAYRRPGEEPTDRKEDFDLSVPLTTPNDGKEWAVEIHDATPEAKVAGACTYQARLELPKLTELSEAAPADAAHATIYWSSITPGEPNDPSLRVKGDLSDGPWKVSAQTVADPATRTLTVTVDAWRAAGEAGASVSQGYDVQVPLPVTDDGKSWKVIVQGQGGRRLVSDDRFWPPGEAFEAPPAVNPAEDLPDATATVPATTDGTGNLVVWSREDRTASQGATVKVGLPGGLLVDPEGLWTSRIHVTGQTVLASAEGQAPFAEGATGNVTSDGFDQVNALWAVNQALAHLKSVGVDLDKLQASKIGNGGLTRVLVNGTDEDNAWYSGTENTLTFGTNQGQFHYAADHDVVVHEFGHYTLDHLNPNMWTGEGPSIHEGFGDAMAALTFSDPQMVEDAVLMPEDSFTAPMKAQGFMRTVENDKKLDRANTWEECHDRGEVYGGFLWSLRGALAGVVGDEAKANELLFGITARHGFFYTSGANLKSEDLVQAMVQSARDYLPGKVEPEVAQKFEAALIAEAQRRNLVLPEWKAPEAVPPLAEKVAEEIEVEQAASPSTPLPETLPTALKAALGYGDRKSVELVPVVEQRLGGLDKEIFRVCVRDSEGALLPVEDGHVAVILDGKKVLQVGGGGTRLPEKLDLRPLPAMRDPIEAAREPLTRLLRGNTVTNAHFRDMVLGRLDEALDPATVKSSEVVYGGKRVLKLSTRFGEFLFDPRAGTVTPNRLAFVA